MVRKPKRCRGTASRCVQHGSRAPRQCRGPAEKFPVGGLLPMKWKLSGGANDAEVRELHIHKIVFGGISRSHSGSVRCEKAFFATNARTKGRSEKEMQ